MLSYEQARDSARRHLGARYVVSDEDALACDFGWVFFYKLRSVEGIAGKAAVTVQRETGEVLPTGTIGRTEEYIDAVQMTGRAESGINSRLVISAWNRGAKKVAAAKLINEFCDVGLAAAKECVNHVLDGQVQVVEARSTEDALRLMLALADVGFGVCRLYEHTEVIQPSSS